MNLKMTFEKTWNRIAIKVIKPVADVRSEKHTYYKYHVDFGWFVKKKKKDTQWSLWSIMTSSESPTRTEQKLRRDGPHGRCKGCPNVPSGS